MKSGRHDTPRLIIAEKPSVAMTIAKAVGADVRKDGYMEGPEYVVTWCYGHLLELKEPHEYDPKYEKWTLADLPIVPEKFQYNPVESGKKQLRIIKGLIERDDITSLIEATDAGREGELIFRLVYLFLGCRKSFERLWISSLEKSAITEGLKNLQPSEKFDSLFKAAVARSRADWLYGINGTRLYTLSSGIAGKGALSVGRVQTPTLAMIVKRQQDIDGFVPEKFSVLKASFGSWEMTSERISYHEEAVRIAAALKGRPIDITEVLKTEKKTFPPRLFSLTDLQREMNRKHSFTADKTLKLIQKLYEEKFLSYPRTDSQYITSDMAASFTQTVRKIMEGKTSGKDLPLNVKRVINNAKVSDHYAIIITQSFAYNLSAIEKLSDDEKKIVDTVMQRMIEAVGEPYEYLETSVKGKGENTEFSSVGKTPVRAGWKGVDAVFRKEKTEKGKTSAKKKDNQPASEFPADLKAGDRRIPEDVTAERRQTAPPALYTEDTLLSAMENAGAKEMDDEVERKGLGTSATRAETIEKLVRKKYIERFGKSLRPTQSGIQLIDTVSEGFKSVDTTVRWENMLLDIEKGRGADVRDFLAGITEEITSLCGGATEKKRIAASQPLGKCILCGGNVSMTATLAKCDSCQRALFRKQPFLNGLDLTESNMKALIAGKKIKRKVFSKKNGAWFEAEFFIDRENLNDRYYTIRFAEKEKKETGTCPVCGGKIVMNGKLAKCTGCGRMLFLEMKFLNGGTFTEDEVRCLFEGKTIEKKIYSSKKEKWYKARLRLDNGKATEKYFDVSFVSDDERNNGAELACPICGGKIVVNGIMAKCKDCGRALFLKNNILNGGSFTEDEAISLFEGKTIEKEIYSSKKEKWYRAHLRLDSEKATEKYFSVSFVSDGKPEGGPEAVCPVCGGKVRISSLGARCEGCGRMLYRKNGLLGGQTFGDSEIITLLEGGTVRKNVYSRKNQKWFMADLSIRKDDENEKYYGFSITPS